MAFDSDSKMYSLCKYYSPPLNRQLSKTKKHAEKVTFSLYKKQNHFLCIVSQCARNKQNKQHVSLFLSPVSHVYNVWCFSLFSYVWASFFVFLLDPVFENVFFFSLFHSSLCVCGLSQNEVQMCDSDSSDLFSDDSIIILWPLKKHTKKWKLFRLSCWALVYE